MQQYEAVRSGMATGFQRCGHIHRSRKAAGKCADKLNKSSRVKDWRVVTA